MFSGQKKNLENEVKNRQNSIEKLSFIKMEANLKKEKIRRDYVRRSIDQYFESLEKLLGSSNVDPDELDECFIILENNVEQLDAINDRIQQLLPPSKVEFETDLKDNEKYRNRWLIMKKKYQNFKVKYKPK